MSNLLAPPPAGGGGGGGSFRGKPPMSSSFSARDADSADATSSFAASAPGTAAAAAAATQQQQQASSFSSATGRRSGLLAPPPHPEMSVSFASSAATPQHFGSSLLGSGGGSGRGGGGGGGETNPLLEPTSPATPESPTGKSSFDDPERSGRKLSSQKLKNIVHLLVDKRRSNAEAEAAADSSAAAAAGDGRPSDAGAGAPESASASPARTEDDDAGGGGGGGRRASRLFPSSGGGGGGGGGDEKKDGGSHSNLAGLLLRRAHGSKDAEKEKEKEASGADKDKDKEGGGGDGDVQEGERKSTVLIGKAEDVKDQFLQWQKEREKVAKDEDEFKAKVRAKQASLAHRTDDEVPVLSILQYLVREIKKIRQYRILPFYILYLVALTVVSALTRFEGFNGSVYYTNVHVKQGMSAMHHSASTQTPYDPLQDTFHHIEDESSYYRWLNTAVARVWDDHVTPAAANAGAVNNLPLGYLVLRQWRVVEEADCTQVQSFRALSPRSRVTATRCNPPFSNDKLAKAPYGGPSGNVYRSNADTSFPVELVEVTGTLHTYDDLSDVYTVLHSYDATKAAVLASLATLSTDGFVDQKTRALSVAYVSYNQPSKTFVYSEFCVEVTHHGMWLPSVRSIAFHFFHLDTPGGYAVIILDGLILLWLVRDALFVIISIKREQDLSFHGYFTLGNWNLFTIVLLLVSGFYYYYRINLWAKALRLSDTFYTDTSAHGGDPEKAMLQLLTEYSVVHHRCFTFLSVVMTMSWLRLFSFVQYNQRISALTDSMKLALTNLVSLGIVFVIVLLGFATGGHVLYGHDVDGFRDILRAGASLVRALVHGYVPEYDQMATVHTFFTAMFFMFFFVLCWLVLLNMVLAVLVHAYSAVQEQQMEENRWDTMLLLSEMKRWWLKIRNKHLQYLCEEGDPDFHSRENYLESRVQAVAVLKNWFFSDDNAPEYIGREKLREFLGGPDRVMCDASIDQVFRKASQKQAVRSHAIRVGERWASQIQSRQTAMEKSLQKLQQYPLEKIQTMSTILERMDRKMEKSITSVEEVNKKAGGLAKELKGMAQSNQSSTKEMEHVLAQRMSQLRTEVQVLEQQGKRSMRMQKKVTRTHHPQAAHPAYGELYPDYTDPSLAAGGVPLVDGAAAYYAPSGTPSAVPDSPFDYSLLQLDPSGMGPPSLSSQQPSRKRSSRKAKKKGSASSRSRSKSSGGRKKSTKGKKKKKKKDGKASKSKRSSKRSKGGERGGALGAADAQAGADAQVPGAEAAAAAEPPPAFFIDPGLGWEAPEPVSLAVDPADPLL